MIKHILTLTAITLSSFALEDAYLLEVSEGVSQYNSYEVSVQNSKQNETLEQVENIDIYEAPKESCTQVARTVTKKISTPNDIKIFKDKTIEPINYSNTISLNKLQVSEKKQKFFHMILPAILISKQKLKVKRTRVQSIMDTENPTVEDVAFLERLYKKYKTTDNKELLSRLKTHPVSIVLAQAAIESAWGESRFFKEGKNIFGMWSYNRNEPRIRAKGTRSGKAIYVRKYAQLSDAIDHYFEVIGRGAYKSFRKQRDITENPLKLVEYLVNYCELKEQYTKKLKKFIIANKLENFDDYEIDRSYI
ncbi:MAG: glucosaminidase domain-containing protein [Epsilonproteobacteria bacterium]|nr:glucosaminidase domain-containing protein [Campylobacterota bacterium]